MIIFLNSGKQKEENKVLNNKYTSLRTHRTSWVCLGHVAGQVGDKFALGLGNDMQDLPCKRPCSLKTDEAKMVVMMMMMMLIRIIDN